MSESKNSIGGLSVAIASKGSLSQLDACLGALEVARDQMAEPASVIVARPEGVEDAASILEKRSWAKLILLDGDPEIPVLRGAAMQGAPTDWVALTEDLFLPHADWLSTLEQLAADEVDVIGGSVGNVRKSAVSHAAYLTDYGSFAPTRSAEENVAALTGSNIAYGPRARDRAARWALEGEWEHIILDRLMSEQASNRFDPSARVDHNCDYNLRDLLAVRFDQGYHYALDRLRDGAESRRGLRAIIAPVLPFVLTLRLAPLAARENLKAFVVASPAVLALNAAWVAGETLGYLRKHRSGG